MKVLAEAVARNTTLLSLFFNSDTPCNVVVAKTVL